MAMKNFKQLMEDARTNEELAKKLEEADKEMRRTGDKAGFIKTAAELGYEVTEQDFPADDLVKLEDGQLDDVAGGILWFGPEDEEGHELNCWAFYYENCRSYTCAESETGKHRFEKQSGCALYICKYCGTTATVN